MRERKIGYSNAGIMLLTEACDNGSLFDFYSKEGKYLSFPGQGAQSSIYA